MPLSSSLGKRRCYCKPTCGKILSYWARRRHKRRSEALGKADEIQSSDTVSSNGEEAQDTPYDGSASEDELDGPVQDDEYDFEQDSRPDTEASAIQPGHSGALESDVEMDSPTDVEYGYLAGTESELSEEEDEQYASDIDEDMLGSDASSTSSEEVPSRRHSVYDEELGELEYNSGSDASVDSDDEHAYVADELDLDMEIELYEDRKCRISLIVVLKSIQMVWTGNAILTEQDRDNLRAFNLRLKSPTMSRETYNNLCSTFEHKMDLQSWFVTARRVALLADLEPQQLDCCVNSCICYTRDYSHLQNCPYCHQPRLAADERPRRQFTYIPLIPRLCAFFQNMSMVEQLKYRSTFIHDPDVVSDVFSLERYQEMLQTKVTIDGREVGHKFFSDLHDIAFGLCTDGFLLFGRRRGGPSATPLLVKIYSLPPTVRTHLENLICLGVIPGPRQPKDLASFLVPFDDECAQLAQGVACFDCATQEIFPLHAYQLFQEGDIIAIEKFLGLKGHSSLCPCRSCLMRGCRMIAGTNKVFYIPITQPHATESVVVRRWNSRSLPPRNHSSFATALSKINDASTKKYEKQLQQHYGVKHAPALQRVNSLDYGCSCPWEWLHLFAKNLIPNLLDIWTGRFKGMDVGTGNYELDKNVWSEIGAETQAAVKNIPSPFVRRMGNIAEDRSTYTAESYAFWFMYLAPHLLADRFENVKYYNHAMDLVAIMKVSLQYTLTHQEIDWLEEACDAWVNTYEEYVSVS